MNRKLLDHADTWVFDLDNTLYPPGSDIFPQIDRRMRRFIADFLGLPEDQAFVLQKRYYREYGTTLRGLMLRHGLEPERYLDYVHAVDHGVLTPDARLDQALDALKGRKLIYTNGSERHAVAVLDRLGITRHFEGIFDIKAARYVPKPEREPYERMIVRHRLDPRSAVMVEDSHHNLAPAAALGMTTVWVVGDVQWGQAREEDMSHCHHVTDDLAGWILEHTGTAQGKG